jgi:hypothetical protein
MPRQWRLTPIALLLVWALALTALVTVQAVATYRNPQPNGQSAAGQSTSPERDKASKKPRSERGDKKVKVPEAEVTLNGTVGTRTTTDGGTEYTLTVGPTVLTLDAGPSWFYGDKHPLQPFVGKAVTVVGTQAAGSTVVDVRSVDGTVIRAPGRPQWAGGWKRLGAIHPGWTQEKWDKWQAKVAERSARTKNGCWPPGLCRNEDGTPVTPNSSAQPSPGS